MIIEEITGKKLGDVLAQAIRRGFDHLPYRASRERNEEGEMLWVHKYEVRDAQLQTR